MKLKLISNIEQNIVPAVRDMAALFDCNLVEEGAELELRIAGNASSVTAIISRGAGYRSCTQLLKDSTSGELARCVKLAVVSVLEQVTHKHPDMPWGVLTGVRPGKLGHKLLESGVAASELPQLLAERYLLPAKQGRLLTDICTLQAKIAPKNEAGLYIGIPFCPTKCSYCSFPSGIIPQSEELQEKFLKLIELDLQNVVQLLSMHSVKVSSLYIGGGTPTSFTDRVFSHFMEIVQKYAPWSSIREFTVEAGRPDCFSRPKLEAMEAVGVNRISVNPQTFHDKTLERIGRKHSVADFYKAYDMTRASRIPIVNMDLIIGLPGETEQDIAYSLECAAKLKPENLTVHTLTLKKDAALFQKQGEISLSAEAAGRMVELGASTAAELGMVPYYLYRQHYMLGHLANVGYAMPGTESLYNIQMMEERHTVMAVGPSSSSKMILEDGHHLLRHAMPKNIAVYENTLEEQFAKRALLLK
ncbi:MAG: coproporphyrinogen dehydrogenase HemZ [Phascolarctobacterium sp.]|nr:coproporphyrinogen dehydrogenase HemZ [Phascolarctobacterium sp.]